MGGEFSVNSKPCVSRSETVKNRAALTPHEDAHVDLEFGNDAAWHRIMGSLRGEPRGPTIKASKKWLQKKAASITVFWRKVRATSFAEGRTSCHLGWLLAGWYANEPGGQQHQPSREHWTRPTCSRCGGDLQIRFGQRDRPWCS